MAFVLGILALVASAIMAQQLAHPPQVRKFDRPVFTVLKYPVTPRKLTAWGIAATAGAGHGLAEALHAEHTVLETKFGADPYSWAGSRAWELKYPGRRYDAGESPVPMMAGPFSEARKTGNFLGRYGLVTSGIVLTFGEKKSVWDYLIGAGVYSVSASLTYQYLRYW